MAPKYRETDAVVIDCRDQGESDSIVTFITRDFGRLSGIAKGAKRSKKRFQNKLELFSLLHLSFNASHHSTLVFLNQAELLHSYLSLRENIDRYVIATLIREATLLSISGKEEGAGTFIILTWALQAIDMGRPPLSVAAFFLLRLYAHLGYHPNLSSCGCCGLIEHTATRFHFAPTSGGLLCGPCAEQERGATLHTITAGTLRLLNAALTDPLERLHRLRLSKSNEQEALALLHSYGRHLFQRDLRSWRAVGKLLPIR